MKQHNYITRFINWWGEQKVFLFVFIAFILYVIVISTTDYLLSLYIENADQDTQYLVKKFFTEDTNYFLAFITLCIFGPMVETIISQNILIRLTRRYISKKVIWQILLSGLYFGLVHCFNLYYILSGIAVGIFLHPVSFYMRNTGTPIWQRLP
jgi:hypothetical protein